MLKKYCEQQDTSFPALPHNPKQKTTKKRKHFSSGKLLLTANSKAQENMSELDLDLHGNTPFGMGFIHSH